MMNKNRQPQTPKRRNFVKKNMDKFHRPQTHRDRTQYDRYEDYLKDQLYHYIDDEFDDDKEGKAEFLAKLKGEEYDPHQYKNYEEYLYRLHEDEFFGLVPVDSIVRQLAAQIRKEIDRKVLESITGKTLNDTD